MGLLTEKIPLLALAAACSAVTVLAQRNAMASIEAASWTARLANAVVSYARYLVQTAWPVDLAVFYPLPAEPWGMWRVTAAFSCLVLVSALVLRFRRHGYPMTGWLWYLGGLVPVIGLVQVGSQAAADRYTYLPSIGVVIVVAWGVWEVAQRLSTRNRRVVACCVTLILAVEVSMARRQLQTWENSETLFSHALAVGAESYQARFSLGKELADQGRLDEAALHYARAIELQPGSPEAHNNLGLVFRRMGQSEAATRRFAAALELDPELVGAHFNLAVTLADEGSADESVEHLFRTLALEPDYEPAWGGIADLLSGAASVAEAASHLARVGAASPELRALAALLASAQGRRDEAEGHLEELASMAPLRPAALRGLRAVAEALRQDPPSPGAGAPGPGDGSPR
jgi:Tfp pilus assembly protein PilF